MFRVLKLPRPGARKPTLDLATVREMLAYMHGDLRHAPGLDKAAAAIEAAIAEIKAAEGRSVAASVVSFRRSRFFARKH